MELKLKAEKRKETGKGSARRYRARGDVPAVLYGLGIEPSAIIVKKDELFDVIHGKAGSNVLIDLTVVDGKAKESHLVMIKEMQRHPFKEKMLHVDFLKVARDEKVTAKVPLAINGEEDSVGLRAGGTLQHNIWELEVECLPTEIPDHLYADVTDLAIGDHLRVADIATPSSVTMLTEPEDTVLTILAPRLVVEEEEVVEAVPAEEVEAAREEIAPAEEKPEEAAPPGEGKG